MRVLFLDIDGVLNSGEYMRERRHIPRPTPHSIDATTVPRLNAVTDRTGAVIVVSSSWRLQKPEHDPSPVWRLRRILGAHGVTGEILDTTPHLVDGSHDCPPWRKWALPRGHEIQAWLDTRTDVEAFAIVDDNSDMAHLADRLVRTDWEHGLLDEHVERLCALLARQHAA